MVLGLRNFNKTVGKQIDALEAKHRKNNFGEKNIRGNVAKVLR